MDMRLKFCFLFVCVLIGISLAGCADQDIKFYRESKFQDLMNNLPQTKSKNKTLNSSGVVIYKSESEDSQNSINFGPKDIEFDLPIK